LGARGGVDAAALLEFGLDLLAPRLAVDVGDQDRPVEELALDVNVDAMAVVVEGRHRIGQIPHLLVLGVKDVRAMGLVEHAAQVLRADKPSRHLGALEQYRADALAGQAVGECAAGQASADDEYGRHDG
jgi:hypothetical protein